MILRLYENETARVYIEAADGYLEKLGYTEHGHRHCRIVSSNAFRILKTLGFSEELATVAAAAGYLHDIGNMLGRNLHHEMGALLAKDILLEVGFSLRQALKAMTAIVIHERDEGVVPDEVSAAVVIADKADVHRSRVRNPENVSEDIHDRVNYAATQSSLLIDRDSRRIVLSLTIDTRISPVIEYFEIFLTRMMACRKAASVLDAEFNLYINNTRMA
ncbi:MAG: HD domain-containing protein [Nitrospirae bacterium]|nr:MAG: HD domain-containing protein [Nitrospirota bacterium]